MERMTKQTATAALIWTAILGTSAIFGSYFFACVFPFAAIATIAALTLDVRRGVALVVATWFANQVVGFTLMHYPQTLDTVALGVSLGLGALVAYAVAHIVLRNGATPVRAVAALGGAFVAYQLVIYAGALGFGGTENFSPAIVARVALNDAVWFAGLVALNFALTRAVPTLFSARVARST
jgi:hypothetical protein